MNHLCLKLILAILFTLSIKSYAADIPAKPRNTTFLKKPLQCEFILNPNLEDINSNDPMYTDGLLTIEFLNKPDIKRVEMQKSLTLRALKEFFNKDDFDKLEGPFLSMRTQFEDDKADVQPEIEIYIAGVEPDQDKVLSIIPADPLTPMLYWKELKSDPADEYWAIESFLLNSKFGELPYDATVGFTSPALSDRDILRRFVSVKCDKPHAYIVVGIDVPCRLVKNYISNLKSVTRIQNAIGLFCRIPVMKTKFTPKD